MAIEVAAWNVHEGLAIARDYRARNLVDQVIGLQKDIVVLSDAYWLDNPLHPASAEVAQTALGQFVDKGGYDVIEADYNDDWLWPRRYMTVLSRVAMTRAGVVRLGERNALELEVKDPATDIAVHLIGAHFSDYSEQKRLAQVETLLNTFDLTQPTVLAGDLNAMPGNSMRAWLLRRNLIRRAATWLPAPAASTEEQQAADIKPRAEHLTDMASGTTLRRLDEAGLHSTGPKYWSTKRRSTTKSRHPVVQLDHILATKHFRASNFQVHKPDPIYGQLSDRRAISVRLET